MSHWYVKKDGKVEPRHFVPYADPKKGLRPSTIRDANKAKAKGEFWVPSVTTIIDILARPALSKWMVSEHLKTAHSIIPYFPQEDWIDEIKVKTSTKMEEAPQAGTDFHNSFEAYIKEELESDDEDFDLCDKVYQEILKKTEQVYWEPEVQFVSKVGFGGMVDLSNDHWVIDFKTKQRTDQFKPGEMVWESHPMQLSTYREGLNKPFAKCANVFVCLEDGQIDFHEHSDKDLDKGWDVFLHALAIWKLQH